MNIGCAPLKLLLSPECWILSWAPIKLCWTSCKHGHERICQKTLQHEEQHQLIGRVVPPLLPTNHVSRSSNSLRQHLNFIWKHSRLRSLPRWWIPWFPKSDFWSVPLVFFSHESQPSTKRAPKKNIAKSTSKSSSLGMAAFCLVFSCSKKFNNGESFTQHR